MNASRTKAPRLFFPVLFFLCLAFVPSLAMSLAAREALDKSAGKNADPSAHIPDLPEVPSFAEMLNSFSRNQAEQIPAEQVPFDIAAGLLTGRPEVPPEPGSSFVRQMVVLPETVHPGEPLIAAFTDDFSGGGVYRAALLHSHERRLGQAPFFTFIEEKDDSHGREVKAALLAVPSTAPAGPMIIRIEGPPGVLAEFPFRAEEREYAAEVIALDQRNTEIRTVPDPQKTAESEQLWAVLSRTGSEIFAPGAFIPPVTSTRRTSFFGDRRVYQYVNGSTDTSVHAGVDYGVPTGTEVRACAPGRVVLARSRIVTGNSVAVEHLPGVYSLYYHLDGIKIAEGDMVSAGTLLGLSGSTGLATGPHLHWEIRVAGENADPDAFTARPVLDKDEILGKLKEIGNF